MCLDCKIGKSTFHSMFIVREITFHYALTSEHHQSHLHGALFLSFLLYYWFIYLLLNQLVSDTFSISYIFGISTTYRDSFTVLFSTSVIFCPSSSSTFDDRSSSRWYLSFSCLHRWHSVISIITSSFSLGSFFC